MSIALSSVTPKTLHKLVGGASSQPMGVNVTRGRKWMYKLDQIIKIG